MIKNGKYKEIKMFKGKKVLVTGSEGLIGKELVELLKERKAIIYRFDIKLDGLMDVTEKQICEEIIKDFEPEYIFHLFGVKGSPMRTENFPVDFMGPILQGDTNMILSAQKYNVKKFLYTSSIAVLSPETDKYPAHAKDTAEKLIDAMRIQYPSGTNYCIVRPSNVYGRYDNFFSITSLTIFYNFIMYTHRFTISFYPLMIKKKTFPVKHILDAPCEFYTL